MGHVHDIGGDDCWAPGHVVCWNTTASMDTGTVPILFVTNVPKTAASHYSVVLVMNTKFFPRCDVVKMIFWLYTLGSGGRGEAGEVPKEMQDERQSI